MGKFGLSALCACRTGHHGYFVRMILLTRREQMLVAFVLTAFVTGLGVQHWRGMRALAPLGAQDVEEQP